MLAGLAKLVKTSQEVKELQKDLAAMKPALTQAQQETAIMLNKIAADTVHYFKKCSKRHRTRPGL